MKIIEGDLILTEDTKFDESIKVEGNIKGYYNLTVKGDIDCWNIYCWDINCRDIYCWNIYCWDINCRDIYCWNINCWNLIFYAFAIAYKSFKCKSWKSRRENYIIKCLDGEMEIKDKEKKYEKYRSVLKDD